jgi:hypothetical protein
MFWVTLAGVIAVVAYTTVAAWQACLMNKQLLIMKQTDETTRESFTAVQRAFITVRDIELVPIYEKEEITHWIFHMNVENSGNTPTKDFNIVRTNTDYPVPLPESFLKTYPGIRLPDGPPDPEDARDSQKRGGISLRRALIGPHAKYPIDGGMGWPAAEGVHNGLPAILAGKTRAFTYGTIHYHDTLKGTPEHVTKYCFGITAENTKDGTRASYYPCAHWNCADDECKGDKDDYEAEITKAFRDVGAEVPPWFK